jgi:hypothetical protein
MSNSFLMATEKQRAEAARIDQEKIRLEASSIPKVKKVFTNMSSDVEALYVTTDNVPAVELSENYYPEFLKEVRDIMRKSIKFFGFDMRDVLEKKHAIFFDVEHKREAFDFQCKRISDINDPDIDAKLNGINNEFARQVTIFVANESEVQARFITDTNAKEIVKAIRQEEELFALDLQDRANRIIDLQSQPVTPAVQRQIARAEAQLAASNQDAKNIVGKNIKANLNDKAIARSALIASQNVGTAEAWARQTEAQLVSDARLATATGKIAEVVKTWIAILDTVTRPAHAAADSQQVAIEEVFDVGGEGLISPRDPNGSPGNVIECRCVSVQEVELT